MPPTCSSPLPFAEDDRLVEEVVQADHLDTLETVVLADLAQLLLAVRTRGHDVRRSGAADLLGLELARDARAIPADLVHRYGAAAPAAAVVLLALRLHVHVVLAERAQDLPRLVNDPPGAGDVAGIVVGDALRDRVGVQLELSLPQHLDGDLHDVDHRQRALGAGERGHEELGAARGVAALPDED